MFTCSVHFRIKERLRKKHDKNRCDRHLMTFVEYKKIQNLILLSIGSLPLLCASKNSSDKLSTCFRSCSKAGVVVVS